MTKNQIEYNKLLETQRHNQRDENIRQSGNELTYQLGRSQLAETSRSNRAKEGLTGAANLETARHNAEQERLNQLLYGETQRSNRANEAIRQSTLVEQNRSNLANEAIRNAANATQAYSAQTQRYLGERSQDEQERSNVAREINAQAQTEVSQALAKAEAARLEEQARHNMATEKNQFAQNVISGVNTIQSGITGTLSSFAKIIPLL